MTREVNYFQKEPPGVWAIHAACRGSSGVHFPDAPVNTFEYNRQVAVAQVMCRGCPVQDQCFDLAVRNREREGVWGGEDFSIRSRRRRLRLAATTNRQQT